MGLQSKVDEFVQQTRPDWASYAGDWRWVWPPRSALDPAYPGGSRTVWLARIKALLDNQPPFSASVLSAADLAKV